MDVFVRRISIPETINTSFEGKIPFNGTMVAGNRKAVAGNERVVNSNERTIAAKRPPALSNGTAVAFYRWTVAYNVSAVASNGRPAQSNISIVASNEGTVAAPFYANSLFISNYC